MKPGKQIFYTLVLAMLLASCKGKEEAKRLIELNAEADLILTNTENNYKRAILALSREIENRGNHPEEITILNAARNRDSLYLALQEDITTYKTFLLKRYNKSGEDFDTLSVLNRVNIPKEFIDTLNLRLNRIVSTYGYETIHRNVQETKRKYIYIKATPNSILVEMSSHPVNIATARAMLTALQVEIFNLASFEFNRIRKLLNPELNFGISKPVVRPVSNIVNEGDVYEADVFFISTPGEYNSYTVAVNVNGKRLPIEGNKAVLSFTVKADAFDKNGLCKKTWEGDFLVKGKDFEYPYHMKEEYFVKKKCDAK
jgi:hypothetical protein